MLKGFLMTSGLFTLLALYGTGNFDNGENNRKMLLYSLLNTVCILSLFPAIPYIIVIAVLGYYNRKHGKTSYTILGKLKNAKEISQAEKDDYLKKRASKSMIDFCEEHYGNNSKVYFYILKAYQDEKINKTQAEVIWEKYEVKPNDIITEKSIDQPIKICFCRKCGTQIGADSRFCRKCGTEIMEDRNDLQQV